MTAARPRWLFLTDSLQTGGSQRAFIEVISHLRRARPEAEIHVGLLYKDGALLPELPEGVTFLDVPAGGDPVTRNVRRVLWLAGRLRSGGYDAAVSFLNYVNLLLLFSSLFARVPRLLVVEQCAVSVDHGTGETKPLAWFERVLWRFLYRRATRVVAISRGIAQELESLFDIHPLVIHNPIPYERIRKHAGAPAPEPFTVGYMGRLVPQKNIPLLLTAFADFRRTAPEARLSIIGDGTERARLETRAKELGLSEAVQWHGMQQEPWAALSKCHVLALSSNFEGFANVLAEALALGLPVISTDCPYGPRDILDGHAAAGALVPVGDAPALAAALKDQYVRRVQERARASERAAYAARFSTAAVGAAYGELL